jgi:signal transduction histidine kinase
LYPAGSEHIPVRGGRDLAQARRLERSVAGLRWIVVAFAVAQTAFALRDQAVEPDYVLPLTFVLVAVLAVGTLALSSAVERARRPEQLRWVGLTGFALDIVVVSGLIWTSGGSPADPIWVIAYVLPLEGAVRYGVIGALAPVGVNLASEMLREQHLVDRFAGHRYTPSAVAFRVGIGLVVAVVAGLMARSLEREAEKARQRARIAEEAADDAERAAERATRARREVGAFHAAILAGVAEDDLESAIRSMAQAVGRDLGCESFAVLLLEDEHGEPVLVASGVHGDPGYAAGERIAAGSGRLGDAAIDGRPALWDEPSEAVVPLRADGSLIGLLHERAGSTGAIDRDRLLLLGRLADQVVLVVQSARLRARQEETLRRLTELDDMKSDFVAITSHELRTPLAAIRGFVDTLRRRLDELSADETREFLGIVDEQTDRLIRLVEDLLVVSRIEAGKITFRPEAVDPVTFATATVAAMGAQAARISARTRPGLPGSVLVDPERLAQVLTNLLQNAVKFSPPRAPVDLEVGAVEGGVAFTVIDHGPGIPPDEHGRVFERFHQTDAAATRRSEGAGLGLYIAKRLVEAMGGRIELRSEVGAGSRFRVILPATAAPSAPARPSRATTAD